MTKHEQVLAAAQRLCAARQESTFRLRDVVEALPEMKASTVRTMVNSYCCVNTKRHHAHRQQYFRRAGYGRYELLPEHRTARAPARKARTAAARDTIHAVISRSDDLYVAECLEVAVVTQGDTLDQTIANLREALDLHLEGEDDSGLTAKPRLAVTYETVLAG
jgi:predicted RNase H-like HicB family nuclease